MNSCSLFIIEKIFFLKKSHEGVKASFCDHWKWSLFLSNTLFQKYELLLQINNKKVKVLPFSSTSLCLWGKGILLKHKGLAKNDQSEPNLIESWLIRCWGSFYLQGTDSACVSFLAQIITQVWRWLEDVVRWGFEVWSEDSVRWKGQIFGWHLNGIPYWDWTCFWVHEMDNIIFGSWSSRTGRILFCTQSICVSVWPPPAHG